ncbi:MAG: hypothetical protein ACOCWR_09450 [Oceanidesulfovibrio sp.]
MNIEWTLSKKRGNFRPVLSYTITLTDYEKSLGVPAVRIQSTIPKPPDAGLAYCWPGQNERSEWTPAEFHLLMTPPHTDGTITKSIKLPWREGNGYPEVDESFGLLRDSFERVLAESSASCPMIETGRLELSGKATSEIAPAFAAERILRAIRAS